MRRYGLRGQPEQAGQVLYNPEAMRLFRYRFRGSKIAAPWEEVGPKEPRQRRMSFDETEFLGKLQEGLVERTSVRLWRPRCVGTRTPGSEVWGGETDRRKRRRSVPPQRY